MLSIEWLSCFDASFKKALKKYPQSKVDVKRQIEGLIDNPNQGTRATNYPIEINKVRIALSFYNISKNSGLRLLFTVLGEVIYPLFIYKKGEYQEKDVFKQTKASLKSILS